MHVCSEIFCQILCESEPFTPTCNTTIMTTMMDTIDARTNTHKQRGGQANMCTHTESEHLACDQIKITSRQSLMETWPSRQSHVCVGRKNGARASATDKLQLVRHANLAGAQSQCWTLSNRRQQLQMSSGLDDAHLHPMRKCRLSSMARSRPSGGLFPVRHSSFWTMMPSCLRQMIKLEV